MSATNRKTAPKSTLDPLYVIFERHLVNFQDPEIDRKTFVSKVVAEYLGYLRKLNITVPRSLEQPIVEELEAQVNTMLVKKIYGCLTIEEYRKGMLGTSKRKPRSRISRAISRVRAG